MFLNVSKSGKLAPFFHKNPLHVSKTIFSSQNNAKIYPQSKQKKHFSQGPKPLCNLLIKGGLFVILFQFDVSFCTCFFISSFSSCVLFYKTFLARLITSIIYMYIVVPEIGFVRCQIIFLLLKCIQYQCGCQQIFSHFNI